MEKCYTSALGQTDYVEVILGVRQVLHKPKDQKEVLLALLPYPTDSLMCLTSQLVIYTQGLHKSGHPEIYAVHSLLRTSIHSRVSMSYESDFRQLRAIDSMMWYHRHPDFTIRLLVFVILLVHPTPLEGESSYLKM